MKLSAMFMGLSERKGKFIVHFDLLCDDIPWAGVESAPVFDTEEEAMAGSKRALRYFDENGKLLSLCVAF